MRKEFLNENLVDRKIINLKFNEEGLESFTLDNGKTIYLEKRTAKVKEDDTTTINLKICETKLKKYKALIQLYTCIIPTVENFKNWFEEKSLYEDKQEVLMCPYCEREVIKEGHTTSCPIYIDYIDAFSLEKLKSMEDMSLEDVMRLSKKGIPFKSEKGGGEYTITKLDFGVYANEFILNLTALDKSYKNIYSIPFKNFIDNFKYNSLLEDKHESPYQEKEQA